MKDMKKKYLSLLSLALCATGSLSLQAQEISTDVRQQMGQILDEIAAREVSIGRIQIDSVAADGKTLKLFANMNCSYIPFREGNVAEIYKRLQALVPADYSRLTLITNSRAIEEQIPLALRQPAKGKKSKVKTWTPQGGKPLVTPVDPTWKATKGLDGRHIALWQSHGWYYEKKLNRWEWQRARIFQTVEDLYTQSYVLPFLVPMLVNAGANVMLPRERDIQKQEVIVDNDGTLDDYSTYMERQGVKSWCQGEGAAFAHQQSYYKDFENPFQMGSFRQIETIKKGAASEAKWIPNIPQAGEYAVYVAYRSLPQSSEDALYTVHHQGGETSFKVNQQIGGGTWIYLGTFPFGEGTQGGVTLSNLSSKAGRIVTADAVKIGGGMGNIARGEVSGYPRFCEAARYWLQWAGAPDKVYSDSHGKNDYTDDYKSRGLWVNWLAGGSSVNPDEEGLHIPIDLAFAFHSDAGTTLNDSIIGTLGIYQTASYDGVFEGGASRYLSRDLTDLIQSAIVHDIRTLYEPMWSRRGMWNQSYFEARVPRVPTMLLELLSHQNFADMRYGLDPRFRFTVSRAIYKGMLQFISSQRGVPYVVQPLAVDHMALRQIGDDEVELTWQPVDDPLEPTAKAEQYIVYTRMGNQPFDQGVVVKENRFRTTLPTGVVCSYKVVAVNAGGRSFDSEILSAGRALQSKGTVLVINGFDRISAPADFTAPGEAGAYLAGFLDQVDHGVPYLKDISYIGSMKEYRRVVPWMDDDASGFGDSYGNYETEVIAGNSFDYPAAHGKALMKAGYSFVSCSNEAVEEEMVKLNDYPAADLILGKQCQTKMGRGGVSPLEFKTFPAGLQRALTAYCHGGGRLLVSGAFVGSDLWDSHVAPSNDEDKRFATEVLKYQWRVGQAATEGKVKALELMDGEGKAEFAFYSQPNSLSYVVESPDAIEPASPEAKTIMRYSENGLSAAVAYTGNDYRTCILGFPIEALTSQKEINTLMAHLMRFLLP